MRTIRDITLELCEAQVKYDSLYRELFVDKGLELAERLMTICGLKVMTVQKHDDQDDQESGSILQDLLELTPTDILNGTRWTSVKWALLNQNEIKATITAHGRDYEIAHIDIVFPADADEYKKYLMRLQELAEYIQKKNADEQAAKQREIEHDEKDLLARLMHKYHSQFFTDPKTGLPIT